MMQDCLFGLMGLGHSHVFSAAKLLQLKKINHLEQKVSAAR